MGAQCAALAAEDGRSGERAAQLVAQAVAQAKQQAAQQLQQLEVLLKLLTDSRLCLCSSLFASSCLVNMTALFC
jgi:hypothetical protein